MLLRCCRKRRIMEEKLFNIFETLDIEVYKKKVLQERYIDVLERFHNRASYLSIIFYASHLIVTIGSILVPALLSVQMNTDTFMFWSAWIISILVTICNGLISLFKIDKKYYFINTTLEMMYSEGWQYIGLSGRYSNRDTPYISATHENQFLIFFHMAEKIKMRQVEEEYWKFTDTTGVGNATNRPTGSIETPVTQQGTLATLPAARKALIEGWLDEMKQVAGLQRRNSKDYSRLDGAKSPTRIRRSSLPFGVSMQQNVQEAPSPESTVVQISSVQDSSEETYQNSQRTVLSPVPE